MSPPTSTATLPKPGAGCAQCLTTGLVQIPPCAERDGCETTPPAIRGDAPPLLSALAARTGRRLPVAPMPRWEGPRADRQQDLPDRARPAGGRSTARLLPGAERQDPM